MLRHQGTKRTSTHNIKLASLLGLTAGFVNAAGFLAFAVLTTNVTGHAALFAERIAMQDWETARVVALWMFLFLLGAFISSVIVFFIGRNQRYSYVLPILVEIIILSIVAVEGHRFDGTLIGKEMFAGSLLFAMGIQNSLVSMVSGSVVRTTHLTGTFTDLGIELAQALQKDNTERTLIRARIKLRLVIIFFFMFGALAGAYLFTRIGFVTFMIPVIVLVYTLFYDVMRIKFKRFLHNWINRKISYIKEMP